ncbi:transcriptional regulator [Chromobacterium vaccinii]|uniref:transcriptional regulator n=1 Tax=Chromobacterium vaccinii TaxID=1108595 RepID=UPI003C711646
MYTIAESPVFRRFVEDYWTEEQRGTFCAWLANNPSAGAVVRGSGGCRKVRWSLEGHGKSGGVRVIYYNMLDDGTIWLLTIYSKHATDNLPSHVLKAIKETIDAD